MSGNNCAKREAAHMQNDLHPFHIFREDDDVSSEMDNSVLEDFKLGALANKGKGARQLTDLYKMLHKGDPNMTRGSRSPMPRPR